jgi:hypothetical protein
MKNPAASREKILIHLAGEASRFWDGAHLYLKIVDSDAAPRMDWHTVTIPRAELSKPECVLKATVFHEWGHRTISPESPEISKVWQVRVLEILKKEFIRFHEVDKIETDVNHLIVNMVTDLWIDRLYLNHEETAPFYREATKWSIEKAKRRMKGAKRAKSSVFIKDRGRRADFKRGQDLFSLFLDLYEAIAVEARGHRPILRSPLAPNAYRILFEGTATEEERVISFTELVKSIIPLAVEFVDLIRIHGTLMDKRNEAYPVDRARIIRLFRSRGMKPGGPELKGVFGLKEGTELFAAIKEMELYGRVIDIVENAHRRGAGKRQFAGFARWRVGHRLPDLLFERSLERTGHVIPNVNTLKKNFMTIGALDENAGLANICLIVDDSGSMGMEENLNRLQEALFSLVLAAEKRQDPVSLIVFGSDVTHRKKPSFDYPFLKRAVASLEGGSGGTCIVPAVREACRLARLVERQTTFIYTDTYVFDQKSDLRAKLERLAALSRVVIFAFSAKESDAAKFARRFPHRDGMKAYFVKPGFHFYEASLKEIYHG